MKVEISERKLESYKRAEKVCREIRWQFGHTSRQDMNKICEMIIHWMKVTGKVKYQRPL